MPVSGFDVYVQAWGSTISLQQLHSTCVSVNVGISVNVITKNLELFLELCHPSVSLSQSSNQEVA